MARNRYAARPPLYGMVLILCAIAMVAFTAYQRAGWWSLAGYGLAAVVGLIGAVLTFGDLS